MDDDRIVGTARGAVGNVEKTVGGMIGDSKLQLDGLMEQTSGAVQDLYGQAKDMAWAPGKPDACRRRRSGENV